MLKNFDVHLKDGRSIPVAAYSYVLDNDQYTFDTGEKTDLQFFKAVDVSGITERIGGVSVIQPGLRRGKV